LGDSYTNSADPTTNYGAATLLDVDGATQITYIQFPLSSIPSGATVSQATLKLYVNTVATELRDKIVELVGSANVEDGERIRMVDRAQKPRFKFKALEAVGIVSKVFRKNFDRNYSVEPGIDGAINLTHPTSAQLCLNFVGA
jgi:hypothetical protein